MGIAVPEPAAGQAGSPPAAPVVGLTDRLSEHYCPSCRATHGFGYCAHASWLTDDALRRRGARFNWR